MSAAGSEPILTLEPLIEAVRRGVEGQRWQLSGLQKTTSHEFEGRWEGESTRSSYLFFHAETDFEDASIDVYLDETSRGLTGNLALVVDLVPLAGLGSAERVLRVLGALSDVSLPAGYARPITLRMRLKDGREEPGLAQTEVRFKIQIPRATIARGASAVMDLAARCVESFDAILRAPELLAMLRPD